MSYRPLVQIGSFTVPEPSKYNATTSTFVDSARNVQGVVVGAVVREDVAAISLEWNFLEPDEWAEILQQFNSNYGGDFYRDVTFLNQVTNSWETRTFYVSDRTAGMFRRDPYTGEVIGYTSPKLDLVEV